MSAETSPAGEANSDSDGKDKGFLCESCGETLSKSASLYHVRNVCESAGVECPKCGVLFTNKHGMKLHHSNEHNASIAGVLIDCDYCGKEYRTSKSKSKRGDHNYCSQACFGKSDNGSNGNPQTLQHEKNREIVNCANCGNDIEVHAYRISRSENHFCDLKCHGEWKSKNIKGDNHPNWQGGVDEKDCEYCGKSIERYERNFGERPFCDHGCYGAWLSENRSGENSPLWKGNSTDTVYYGPNWRAQKKKALKRDQYRCQRCLKTENNLSRKPDVHHLRRIKWYKNKYDSPEWYEKGNRLKNLVCLCASCHKKWEGIPLRPQ